MAALATTLEQLMPMDALRRTYEFKGDENITMKEAMRVMEELQEMDQLERQLRRAKDPDDLDKIDPAEGERLLGEDAARELQQLRELAKKLEEARYLAQRGGELQLTARAMRKIGTEPRRAALRPLHTHTLA